MVFDRYGEPNGPSVFVKSVGVVRETVLSGGKAQMPRRPVSEDTRLVGPAELTVPPLR
jgi:hypothetical protein